MGGGESELYTTTHISYHYACNEGCYRKDYILVIQYEEETQQFFFLLSMLSSTWQSSQRHQVKCEQKARHIRSSQLFGVIYSI